MKTGLSVPAPAGNGEKEAEIAGKAGIIGLANRLGRRRRVEVDGHPEMRGSFKDREKARGVKKQAPGSAIDESAAKTELCDAAAFDWLSSRDCPN
jgi:hypothetical protein